MAARTAPDLELAADLSEVVGRIYDCALDQARWPHALTAISSFIGGNRVRLFLFNTDAAQPGDGDSIGVDQAFNRAFDRDAETLASIKYGFVVAEMDKAMALTEILGTSGGRDVNGRLPYDNRFWREWMAPRGAHDALAVLVLKTSQRFGGLAMTRSTPLPAFGPRDKRRMELIAPHVRRALTISELVEQRTLARDQLGEIIDSLVTPVVIVDRKGLIARANPAAQSLIAARAIVLAENGVLTASDREARAPLWRAIAENGHGATMALRATGSPGMIATVLPLGASAAAVFFHHADAAAHLPGEAFARLYGLTGTELRIVMLLVAGAGVVEIAERLDSANETVRWHLKNLRAKTGCARISEVAMLARQAVSPVALRAGVTVPLSEGGGA